MNFVALFQALDTSQSTNSKRDALIAFIRESDPLESALALEALTDRTRGKRLKPNALKQTAYLAFGEDRWLFEECYSAVGDLSETLAILFADQETSPGTTQPVLADWIHRQEELGRLELGELANELLSLLKAFSKDEAFLFLKLSS